MTLPILRIPEPVAACDSPVKHGAHRWARDDWATCPGLTQDREPEHRTYQITLDCDQLGIVMLALREHAVMYRRHGLTADQRATLDVHLAITEQMSHG